MDTEYLGLIDILTARQTGLNSIDQIYGNGNIEEFPKFLVNALRNIVYRLKQTGLWSSDYDIKLFLPKEYYFAFFPVWTKYFLGIMSEIELNNFQEKSAVIIDNINIQVEQSFGNSGNFGAIRTGKTDLIYWDKEANMMLFRAPWATARYDFQK